VPVDDETVASGTQKHFVRVMWSFCIPRPKESAKSRMGQSRPGTVPPRSCSGAAADPRKADQVFAPA
jgi:hypothetical protein